MLPWMGDPWVSAMPYSMGFAGIVWADFMAKLAARPDLCRALITNTATQKGSEHGWNHYFPVA